ERIECLLDLAFDRLRLLCQPSDDFHRSLVSSLDDCPLLSRRLDAVVLDGVVVVDEPARGLCVHARGDVSKCCSIDGGSGTHGAPFGWASLFRRGALNWCGSLWSYGALCGVGSLAICGALRLGGSFRVVGASPLHRLAPCRRCSQEVRLASAARCSPLARLLRGYGAH